MKTMKKLALYLLIPALLTACGTRHPYDNPDELGVIYENDETGERAFYVPRLTAEEIATKPVIVTKSYVEFMDESWYDMIAFAVVGKVSNIKEFRIDYTDIVNGEREFTYETMFDLTIDKIHYIKDIESPPNPGDTIMVNSPHSSYDFDKDMDPILEEGDEYLIFITLFSTIAENYSPYDATTFSEYVVLDPCYNFIKKYGDYYEISNYSMNNDLKEYDSERISKADAFGVNNSNYIAAGYHLEVDKVYVDRVNGSKIIGGEFEPREAVLKSPVYAELYLEYIEENSEAVFNFEDEAPQDHNWIDYIDYIPQNLKDMLFEKTLKKYNYTFPDKLEGYDYELGFDLEYPDGFDELNAFQGISDSVYLYRAEAFENTIRFFLRQPDTECSDCNGFRNVVSIEFRLISSSLQSKLQSRKSFRAILGIAIFQHDFLNTVYQRNQRFVLLGDFCSQAISGNAHWFIIILHG